MPHRASLLILLAFLLSACLSGTPASPTAAPTRTRIPFTLTPPFGRTTQTPTPTRTPLATLIPTRTPTLTPDVDATVQAFLGGIPTPDYQAIPEELQALDLPAGVDLSQGSLVWYGQDPVVLSLKNYNQTVFSAIAGDQEFFDFILRVEITWNSRTGLAGCGVILRSEAPIVSGRQYQFSTLRLSGAPAWDVEFFENGTLVPASSAGVRYDHTIQIAQGSTNTYYLLARGEELTVIANQVRLGVVSIPRRAGGLLGWVGFQESGETTCIFANAWIWDLNVETK